MPSSMEWKFLTHLDEQACDRIGLTEVLDTSLKNIAIVRLCKP